MMKFLSFLFKGSSRREAISRPNPRVHYHKRRTLEKWLDRPGEAVMPLRISPDGPMETITRGVQIERDKEIWGA
jgi:hypothetical protein